LSGSSIPEHGIRLRDDFTQRTIADVAKAVGYRCSNLDCQRLTVGSNADHNGVISLGVGAHITAASAGGPRYDEDATPEARKGKDNCIWLCQDCAKLIDSDPKHFTVKLLQDWKHGAEDRTFRELVAPQRRPGTAEEVKKIEAALSDAACRSAGIGAPEFEKICQAALTDLAGFKRMAALPSYAVALNLRIHGDQSSPSFTIERLPSAIDVAHEVCIIAPPGTGKTTTLLQLADAVLASNKAIALFVRLGEWSTQGSPIMASISERRAFRGIDPADLTSLADEGRLMLLLDGWNELDVDSRGRLRTELTKMRRELPELRIVISTRRQALDVPVPGPKVDVETLFEHQQLVIARGISGAAGERVLDQARRTPGMRSLISTPLYLTSLLKGAPGGTLPTTKEEVLRMFAQEQERMAEHEEPLQADLLGCHERFLTALAVEATQTANTAISDFRARTVVTAAADALAAEGQINERPEPKTVLEVLVSHHTLIRTGSGEGGVSFQHQQFEEWYASFEVEQAMRNSVAGDDAARRHLRVDILNQPAWEESILFACERVSRMAGGADIVGDAVLLALAIDPMLAAEMIYRSDAVVWERVSADVVAFANRWHRAEAADQAARFMVMTGRPEFAPTIWPLATSEDSQVQLPVLRNPPRFRPAVLGLNLQDRVRALLEGVRKNLLSSLVFEGGFDGIDLASEIAKTDPSAEVQFAVVEALLFRRAERHAAELLSRASDAVWQLLAQKGYADELTGDAATRMNAERRKLIENEQNPLRRVGFILNFASGTDADSDALSDSVASPDFPARDQHAAGMLHRSFRDYPGPIARGLLQRLEAGLEIPFRTDELLTDVPSIDDGPIAAAALDPENEQRTGHVAARLVGPKTTGSLMDIYLDLNKAVSMPEGRTDRALGERYHAMERRIDTTRVSSFVPAILSRRASSEPRVIGALARLVARHGSEDEDRKRPLPLTSDQVEPTISMVRGWVDAVIPLADSEPYLVADVALAAGRIGRVDLIPDLKRLLDADLARLKKQAQGGPRRGARMLYTNQYSAAFARIDGDAIIPVVSEYLEEYEFGFQAGVLLVEAHHRQSNTAMWDPMRRWPDFSYVGAARERRRSTTTLPSSPMADRLFAAIERLGRPENESKAQLLAIQLGKLAVSIPHGDRRETLARLLSLPEPIRSKRELLAALVMYGEVVSADMVMQGVRAWIDEKNKNKHWIIDQHFWEIEGWLELLPFSDRPETLLDAIAEVNAAVGREHEAERVVTALSHAPGEAAERLLEQLARNNRRLASRYNWESAIVRRGTASSTLLLIDLVAEGALADGHGGMDAWSLSERLVPLVDAFPEVKSELVRRYQAGTGGQSAVLIEHIFAKLGDVDCFLALVQGYVWQNKRFDGLLDMAIRDIALRKELVEGWSGAFEYQPVAIAKLRKDLFAMLSGTPQEAALATGCLAAVDALRDEHGSVATEPRHPDIESGRPWPLVPGETPQ
jgi:hypothetical protein